MQNEKIIHHQFNLFIFSSQQNLSNNHTHNKRLQTVDENSNILCDIDSSSNEYNQNLILNDYEKKDENKTNLINSDNIQQTVDDINSKVINQKLSSIIKPTPLDAIVEDLNEENSDEFDETIQPVRQIILCFFLITIFWFLFVIDYIVIVN